MRKLMIVMALLVAGCLPKGYYTPQYHGTDAATIVLYGHVYGDFVLDGNAVEPVEDRVAVSPGRHTLLYHRGSFVSIPLSREFVSGKTYYYEILASWNGDYFSELTQQEHARMLKNDKSNRDLKENR